jgi:hypothetical protein
MVEARKCRGALCAALLAACACSVTHVGRDDEDPIRPDDSTETGNPPVIDITRVALVIKQDEVHVVGEPGAVMPGGILVKVERVATAVVETGQVAEDGSFDVRVEGELFERYRLRAVREEPAAVSDTVSIDRGGADITPLSCEQIEQQLDERFAQFPAVIDAACDRHEDCTALGTPDVCPGSTCVNVAIAYADRGGVRGSLDAVANWLCAEHERAECRSDLPSCPAPGPAACVAGLCRNCAFEDCAGACEPCELPELTWSRTGPEPGTTHMLTQCTRYTAIRAQGPQCNSDLPCASPPGSGARAWTALDLHGLLARSGVRTGLYLGAFFGRDVPGGTGMQITVGDRTMTVTDAPCEDTEGCKQPYPEVLELRDLLARIAEQQEGRCP